MILKISIEGEPAKELEIQDGVYIIGRSSKATIQINAEGISREHAKIRIKDGSIYITDLGSVNGTFINFEKIPPNIESDWPDFFPVQLSAIATLEISSYPSESGHSQNLLTSTPSKTVNFIKDTDKTNATVNLELEKLKNSKKLSPTKPKTDHKKNSKTFNHFKKVFPLFILSAGLIYSLQMNKIKKNTEGVQNQMEGSSSVENGTNTPTRHNVLSTDLANQLNQIRKTSPCLGPFERELCQYLKMRVDQNEGVHIVESKIYFFIDLKQKLLNAEIEPSFSNITDFDLRFKIILLQIAFQQLRVAIKNNKLTTIIMSNMSDHSPRNVLIVNIEELSRPTNIDLMQIFSEVQNNKFSSLNKNLLPLIKYFDAN